MDQRIEAMAKVLTGYSTKIKRGDEVYLVGELSTLPLMRALYREVVDLEAHVHTLITDQAMREILLKRGSNEQLMHEPAIVRQVAEKADVMIELWGEENTKALSNVDAAKISTWVKGMAAIHELFFERMGNGALRWCGTQFPTSSSAQDAAMSLSEYEDFVFGACLLDRKDPVVAWKEVEERQEALCKHLDTTKVLHIVSKDTDITMRVEGRKWINCCGQQNFPDGEVFTGPIEDSVEGRIRFSFPGISYGKEIENIQLVFEKGRVIKASAAKGEDILNQLLAVDEGASRVGEIGIGTNYGIKKFTKNMLFDEKIGGTVHLAIGHSLPETLGKNQSSIHWDMLCDMREEGMIWADGELVYEKGKFLI